MSAERGPQRWGRVMLAAVLVVAGGCTICPDPFDYSGPVPNGSPPQNDFRARSNGILPLGAAPRPFPPVVDAGPAPAVPQPVQKSEAGPTAVVPAGLAGGAGATALPVIAEQEADLQEVDAEAESAAVPEPRIAAEAAATPLAETPGWRARD